MSKRPGAVPEETRSRILAAAGDEFAAFGFQGSSLRRICTAAGVTTGALYFFFQGKDDLFRTLIAQVTEPFDRLILEHYQAERSSPDRESEQGADADFEVSRLLIDQYFANRQTWDILVQHLSYPAVREFLDRFIDVSTEHYVYLLEREPHRPSVDRFAIHQFVHMQVDTMLTLISHGFDREAMLVHSKTVIRMLRGAFHALLAE